MGPIRFLQERLLRTVSQAASSDLFFLVIDKQMHRKKTAVWRERDSCVMPASVQRLKVVGQPSSGQLRLQLKFDGLPEVVDLLQIAPFRSWCEELQEWSQLPSQSSSASFEASSVTEAAFPPKSLGRRGHSCADFAGFPHAARVGERYATACSDFGLREGLRGERRAGGQVVFALLGGPR